MTDQDRNDLLIRLDERTANIETKLDEHMTKCVTRAEFLPVQRGMWATIAIVMSATAYKILSLIGLK